MPTTAAFLLAFLIAPTGFAGTADASVLLDADRAFAAATEKGRLEGFSSFLAEDAATLRPDSPVIRGRKAVAERWASLLNNPAMSIRWQPLDATISSSGDLGYTLGTYEIVRSGENAGVAATGKYVTIWKKQADGAWKVVFDSGVPDTPKNK
jgi:ketosteroid isomerase-like protein